LTHLLFKLRGWLALMNAEARGKSFSLCKNIEVSNADNKYFHGIKVVKSELSHLHSEKLDLV
jgi:hypothetical protein